jgi:hypothetical protein
MLQKRLNKDDAETIRTQAFQVKRQLQERKRRQIEKKRGEQIDRESQLKNLDVNGITNFFNNEIEELKKKTEKKNKEEDVNLIRFLNYVNEQIEAEKKHDYGRRVNKAKGNKKREENISMFELDKQNNIKKTNDNKAKNMANLKKRINTLNLEKKERIDALNLEKPRIDKNNEGYLKIKVVKLL